MTNHAHAPIVRRCDVAVVGGSAAGLAAALQIQRQGRSVIVLDSGEPRNAPAAHMHGYLGYDGKPPSDLTAKGRAEVRRYGGEVLTGRVDTVERSDEGFTVHAGHVNVRARRVVAATGVTDHLPSVAGIDAHWGDGVLHCPFCHGYEVRDKRLVQLVTHPLGLHPARLFVNLSGHLTLVVDPAIDVEADELASLESAGAAVVAGTAERIIDEDRVVTGVVLTGGRQLAADAVVVTPRLSPRVDAFAALGLTTELHPSGIGDVVPTEVTGETNVEGLYAAGNLTDPSQQVLSAAAEGSRVGAMVAFDLAADDLATADPRSANEAEWDSRYEGDEIWSGQPNGTLVAEVDGRSPGRALDVGAGEGGDALWLASEGWKVTASDITGAGFDRLAARATADGLDIRCLVTDANALDAYGAEAFDLVSLCYSAIPRTGDDRAVTNLLRAVAPGGTLLMVGHAPPAAETDHQMPWDRHAFVGIDHLAAAIAGTPGWTIETNEVRERHAGSATGHQHDRDVVFRASFVGHDGPTS